MGKVKATKNQKRIRSAFQSLGTFHKLHRNYFFNYKYHVDFYLPALQIVFLVERHQFNEVFFAKKGIKVINFDCSLLHHEASLTAFLKETLYHRFQHLRKRSKGFSLRANKPTKASSNQTRDDLLILQNNWLKANQ